MKTYWTILVYVLVGTVAFLGIYRDSVAHAKGAATAAPSCCDGAGVCKLADATTSEKEDASPKISFESTVFDLGQVGLSSKNACEFKFTNTGQATLKIPTIRSTCGCTVPELKKKEYAPGESGTIKVTYTAPKKATTTQRNIYVSTNDKANPKVRLTIKAKITQIVQADPVKLELSLRKKNLGLSEITIRSLDNQPFSIKSFSSTNCNCIAADIDPNLTASKFVLHPMADIEKLKDQSKGFIEVQLTHPQCRSIRIPYDLLPEFKATPAQINLLTVKPGQAITREITVASNYGEAFEIESASSKNGHIKILSRKKVGDTFKFNLQITPPPSEGRTVLTDTLNIGIKGKKPLTIACHGFYPRATAPKRKNEPPRFKADPQTVKVLNTDPGKAVIAVVLVSSSKGEDFQIKSADSQKGIVKLTAQTKLKNGYKLELKVTPPPSKHRLGIYSDVLNVTIRSKTGNPTTTLPIPVRATYSRPRR